MTIVLIRHGEAFGNLANSVDPGYESSLTDRGISTAKKLINLFSNSSVVISSPMNRAMETAAIVYPNKKISLDKRLEEIDFGNYKLINKSEIMHDNFLDSSFPGGESYRNVISRVELLIDSLLVDNKDYCLFTHGGVMSALLQNRKKLLSKFPLYEIDYCGYIEIDNNNSILNLGGIKPITEIR